MAKVSVQFICGCGFKTSVPKEAESHCDVKGHKMTIQGNLMPRVSGTSRPSTQSPTRVTSRQAAPHHTPSRTAGPANDDVEETLPQETADTQTRLQAIRKTMGK